MWRGALPHFCAAEDLEAARTPNGLVHEVRPDLCLSHGEKYAFAKQPRNYERYFLLLTDDASSVVALQETRID